ncbi:MAG: tRNA (adenosine(37)-N6)-dimethylallyltransferase MiaA [Rhodospirillales bacterium]
MNAARAWVLAGPTASGKSALALDLAEAFSGTVINADASQLYRELPILSAQPHAADRARAPHRLYGCRSAGEPASAGQWRDWALAEIAAAQAAGRQPLLVGGSGLYLQALSRGLAPIPPVPVAVRTAAEALLEELGPAGLHARLAREDPATAAALAPGDRQRLLRAWSVLRASGRPLSAWQSDARAAAPKLTWIVLLPERAWLRQAVAARFEAMLAAGALEEVRRLLALNLDPTLPAMKAVGVRELTAVLDGRASLEAASAQAVTATRQYLKRQTTWLRHQVLAGEADVHVWHAQYSCALGQKIVRFLREGR